MMLFCPQSLMMKTRMRGRRMKMQTCSTGNVLLWDGKMRSTEAPSRAAPPHLPPPVTPAWAELARLWSSRTMKKSTPTPCCWPPFPAREMRKQRRKRRKKDALQLNLKDWVWSSEFSLYVSVVSFGQSHPKTTNVAHLVVILCVLWMFSCFFCSLLWHLSRAPHMYWHAHCSRSFVMFCLSQQNSH